MNFQSPLTIGMSALLAVAAATAQAQAQPQSGGMVYTETNSAAANAVVAFRHTAGGTLTQTAEVATGGLGTEGVWAIRARWRSAATGAGYSPSMPGAMRYRCSRRAVPD